MKPMIKYAGEAAVVIVFGEEIDEKINSIVHAVAKNIESDNPEWLEEVVPTYTSVYVYYDPIVVNYDKLRFLLKNYLKKVEPEGHGKTVKLPVVYGGKYGPDIEFVAKYNGLSVEDVIELHCKPLYRVYMLGFLPGFAYLGGMDKRIATPRLKVPRLRVPAGSVGIAGDQTGWYAIDSPGGWRIIGRTPVRTFNPDNEPPSIVLPGDYVQFVPINEDEFEKYRGEILD